MHYLVYQTTNLINGKRYIGVHRTPDIDDGYMGSGKWLKVAIRKHGLENFTREILEILSSAEEMFAAEIRLIAEMKPEYNMSPGGYGGSYGPVSEESRKKMSVAKTGKRRPPFSEETKKKMSASGIGRIFSEDHRRNMRKPRSAEARRNMSAAQTRNRCWIGRKHSDEARKKMREAAQERRNTKETERLSDVWEERHSEET